MANNASISLHNESSIILTLWDAMIVLNTNYKWNRFICIVGAIRTLPLEHYPSSNLHGVITVILAIILFTSYLLAFMLAFTMQLRIAKYKSIMPHLNIMHNNKQCNIHYLQIQLELLLILSHVVQFLTNPKYAIWFKLWRGLETVRVGRSLKHCTPVLSRKVSFPIPNRKMRPKGLGALSAGLLSRMRHEMALCFRFVHYILAAVVEMWAAKNIQLLFI